MELKIKAVSPKIGAEIPFPYYASAELPPWISTPVSTRR